MWAEESLHATSGMAHQFVMTRNHKIQKQHLIVNGFVRLAMICTTYIRDARSASDHDRDVGEADTELTTRGHARES